MDASRDTSRDASRDASRDVFRSSTLQVTCTTVTISQKIQIHKVNILWYKCINIYGYSVQCRL